MCRIISWLGAVTSCVRASCDSLSEVEEWHGDPAQSLDAAALLPLLLGSSGGRQRAGVQSHRQLRLSGQLVDLHWETDPAQTQRRGGRRVRKSWTEEHNSGLFIQTQRTDFDFYWRSKCFQRYHILGMCIK